MKTEAYLNALDDEDWSDDIDEQEQDDSKLSPRQGNFTWAPNTTDPRSRTIWALGEAVLTLIIRRGWTHAIVVQKILDLRGWPRTKKESEAARNAREKIESDLGRLIGGTGIVTKTFLAEIEAVLGCDPNFLRKFAVYLYRMGNLSVLKFARRHLASKELTEPAVWEEIREARELFLVSNGDLVHSVSVTTGHTLSQVTLDAYLSGRIWLPVSMQIAMAEQCGIKDARVSVTSRLQSEVAGFVSTTTRNKFASLAAYDRTVKNNSTMADSAARTAPTNPCDQTIVRSTGKCIKIIRVALGRTQADVGQELNLTRKVVGYYEQGRGKLTPERQENVVSWLTAEATRQNRVLTVVYEKLESSHGAQHVSRAASGRRIQSMTLTGGPASPLTSTVIVQLPDEPSAEDQ